VGRGAGTQLAAPGSSYCGGAAGSGYPPGNQLLIPGERFNATIVRYLEFARDFNEKFPGFETDTHCLVKDGNCGAACCYETARLRLREMEAAQQVPPCKI
jgi:Orn/Lys/Arg decarboxylase, C-terminal domain